MPRRPPQDRVFAFGRRNVLRKHIPSGELVFAGVFLVLLILIGIWVIAQRGRFDPRDRDVSSEVLLESGPVRQLIRQPIKRWGEASGIRLAAPDTGVFAASLLDGGWTLDGAVESWTPANLYEKIDGAAEQYLRFGFVELQNVTLAKDGLFITVEVYDQGSFPGALGIFAAQRDSSRKVERRGAHFVYETPVGFIGLHANDYFKITGSAIDPLVTTKAEQLLTTLAELPVEAGSAPRIFTALSSGMGLPFDRISYQAANVFRFDFLEAFWFAQAEPGSNARLFVHEEKDEESAQRLVDRLRGEQEMEYELRSKGPGGLVFEHKFIPAWFLLRREGTLLFGVERAKNRAEAERLAARLGEVLRD